MSDILPENAIIVRPNGSGSTGIALEWAGSSKLDFRQSYTRKIDRPGHKGV